MPDGSFDARSVRAPIRSVERSLLDLPPRLRAELVSAPRGAACGRKFSTAEAAQFFERSTPWVYWGLRNQVFCDAEGKPVVPERGDQQGPLARRKFTTATLRAMLLSAYRRGRFTDEELERALRRIRITESGDDWRQQEGWRLIRGKWIHPDKCELVDGEWVRTPTQ